MARIHVLKAMDSCSYGQWQPAKVLSQQAVRVPAFHARGTAFLHVDLGTPALGARGAFPAGSAFVQYACLEVFVNLPVGFSLDVQIQDLLVKPLLPSR